MIFCYGNTCPGMEQVGLLLMVPALPLGSVNHSKIVNADADRVTPFNVPMWYKG